MSDQNPDLAFQEVDEEIRRERVNALWKAYGKYIIAVAVAIVIVVAGNETYNSYRNSIEEENSSAFRAAIDSSVLPGADPVAVWEAALPDMQEGYAALSQLRLAAAYVVDRRFEAAIQTYEKLAADPSAEEAMRELAQLNAAMLIYSERGDADTARAQFSTIAVKGKPWYYSALEQLAIIDLSAGDDASALLRFSTLATDAQTPPAVRTRSEQFRDFLENKQLLADMAAANADEGADDQDSVEETDSATTTETSDAQEGTQ